MLSEKRIQLKQLFRDMSDLTAPECGSKCRCTSPTRCCDAMYCEMAVDFAKQFWGEDIRHLGNDDEHIPFLGPGGCVLPPHFRPLCTLHTCEINSFGIKRNDPTWTKRYFELREQIEEVQYGIEEQEAGRTGEA